VTQAAAARSEESERLPATGPSFRDATRVAGANSAIWTDIYLSNRDALAAELERTVAGLEEFRAALASGDANVIAGWNERAARDPEGRGPPAARQVDLPPGGAAGRHVPGAGGHPRLPGRRRHALHAGRADAAGRRGRAAAGRRRGPRRRPAGADPARRADRRG